MTDPSQLPTAWWRRAARAVDAGDVAGLVSLALIACGVIMLWGLAIMLLVLGIIGAAAWITAQAAAAAAARSDR